ncbi:MAG: hypothetical protein GF309_04125 [Candidatus Lokiarchaeota archaeon]|nr:hypothetical protein [Candidatus Lokiarchaeota archaeon]
MCFIIGEFILCSDRLQYGVSKMIDGKSARNFVILILILLPVISTTFQPEPLHPTAWIVMANNQDENTSIAAKTLQDEVSPFPVRTVETDFERLDSIPLHEDMIVLVGHGQPDGLETPNGLILWSMIYDAIAARQPQKAVILACHSPSDPSSNIFGFDGNVDAEAGAILIGWYLKRLVRSNSDLMFPFNRVSQAQQTMLHPLGRYLYFVHGYWGDDLDFLDMRYDFSGRDYELIDYTDIRDFSYFEHYNPADEDAKNHIHWNYTLSDFADNFAGELLDLSSGSQVNIIAHSMGGVIVREMLALHRTELDTANIDIGKVIMLGTPNLGTSLADPTIIWADILSLLGGFLTHGSLWPSPVYWSMTPWSPLILGLNCDPMSYSTGINWYTTSGYDPVLSALVSNIHGDLSDPIVARGRAHLSFADKSYFDVDHYRLINDEDNQATYDTVFQYATEGTDSDGDGLTDDAETYYHETDPNDWDSDNDGLSDYDEVSTHGTDPTDSNSDNDWINDGDEIAWGYNPNDPSDPVPYSALISSVSVVDSTVRAYVTHYSPMDYVKFYAKYRTKFGSWTSYSYCGIDSTPSSGKYYRSWTHPSGYAKMMVMVKAYDSNGHLLGIDTGTYTIGDGGGGGGGGGGDVPF